MQSEGVVKDEEYEAEGSGEEVLLISVEMIGKNY